jgi:hypothetical protein
VLIKYNIITHIYLIIIISGLSICVHAYHKILLLGLYISYTSKPSAFIYLPHLLGADLWFQQNFQPLHLHCELKHKCEICKFVPVFDSEYLSSRV